MRLVNQLPSRQPRKGRQPGGSNREGTRRRLRKIEELPLGFQGNCTNGENETCGKRCKEEETQVDPGSSRSEQLNRAQITGQLT